MIQHEYVQLSIENMSRLAQLVERVTSNDEVSRSSRLMGTLFVSYHHPWQRNSTSGAMHENFAAKDIGEALRLLLS